MQTLTALGFLVPILLLGALGLYFHFVASLRLDEDRS